MEVTFPADGQPPSRMLTTSYQRPRVLYLTAWFIWMSIALGRYFLWFLDRQVLPSVLPTSQEDELDFKRGTFALFCLNFFDMTILFVATVYMSINNTLFHHREHWLKKPALHLDPQEITHALAILHYKEPKEQLLDLVKSLAEQECKGKKVLILGMERGTPEQQEKVDEVMGKYKDSFAKVLYTIHDLRRGEIPGTGSNHFQCQVAAEQYFADKDTSNVIFSKFDSNMRLAGPLLQEMEAVWCYVDPSKRLGINFMPNVCWAADVSDAERSFVEKFVSLTMSVAANQAPFCMAYVSGALDSAIKVGYTPPGLLSEDELMFSKRACLLPRAATYRLSSYILKVFYPPRANSFDFVFKVFLPKLERWWVGWIEVHAYLIQWIFGRCGLSDHPPVQYPCRACGALLLSVTRMYCGFCIPLNTIPMGYATGAMSNFWDGWANGLNVVEKLLIAQNVISWILGVLTAFQMLRIQCRLYSGFGDCLKFSVSTLAVLLVGAPLLMLVPLRLLWRYFVNGIKNQPVVHTANADGFNKASGAPTPQTTSPETKPRTFSEVSVASKGCRSPAKTAIADPQMEAAMNVLAMNSSYYMDVAEVEEARSRGNTEAQVAEVEEADGGLGGPRLLGAASNDVPAAKDIEAGMVAV